MSVPLAEITDNVMNLEIIDTHEHLPAFEENRPRNTDVLQEYLGHYFSSDLVSAGLKEDELQQVMDPALPLLDRWRMAEPYWEAARHTGYGRSLDLSVKALYGFDRIDAASIEPLNEAFQVSLAPGQYRRVLKDKSRIQVSLLDAGVIDCDRDFFRSVFKIDRFVWPVTLHTVEEVERETGMRIRSLDDWLVACEGVFYAAMRGGAAAVKCALAYNRPLEFKRRIREEAESDFNDVFRDSHLPHWVEPARAAGRAFQDYMVHFFLGLAEKSAMTCQFHTGIQEGYGNLIGNADPALMTNLFLEYPGVKFDIFHIGYPYQQVLTVLAKSFPNVYIDMCWSHIVSPVASLNALAEWIETVPLNKISAFGGDYKFVDGICGHQYMARINVSKALAGKVEEGVLNTQEAVRIARMLFFENPASLFGLDF